MRIQKDRVIMLIATSILFITLHDAKAQEKLWKGTFEGWTFGYSIPPFDSTLYWKILDNGDLLATGGDSYATQSGIRTNKKYENYELTLEYKWLTAGNTPKTGNSGIWIHGQEGFTQAKGAFPKSIEVQLKKSAAGDLLRKGLEIDAEAGYASEGEAVFRRTENKVVEHFFNEWNRLKIKCQGAEISVWLNGVFINKAINCRTKSNNPVTSGYITLQSEIDNLVFRNIIIKTDQ
jgi:hypothetical protein